MAYIPSSIASVISADFPAVTGNTAAWFSAHPTAAVSWEAVRESIIIANPTVFPSLFETVVVNYPSRYSNLFTSVAYEVLATAIPASVLDVLSTNTIGFQNAIETVRRIASSMMVASEISILNTCAGIRRPRRADMVA